MKWRETEAEEGEKKAEYEAVRRKHLDILRNNFLAKPSAETLMSLFSFRPGLRVVGDLNVEEAIADAEKHLPEIAVLREKDPLEFQKFTEMCEY
jgi:hypothetical protein